LGGEKCLLSLFSGLFDGDVLDREHAVRQLERLSLLVAASTRALLAKLDLKQTIYAKGQEIKKENKRKNRE
jgi:hypothetical protein